MKSTKLLWQPPCHARSPPPTPVAPWTEVGCGGLPVLWLGAGSIPPGRGRGLVSRHPVTKRSVGVRFLPFLPEHHSWWGSFAASGE